MILCLLDHGWYLCRAPEVSDNAFHSILTRNSVDYSSPSDVDSYQPDIFFHVSSTDPEHQERFEHWLCEVNSSDGISLLTALAHMATPTQHSDPAFITTITLLIYQVRQREAKGMLRITQGVIFLIRTLCISYRVLMGTNMKTLRRVAQRKHKIPKICNTG